MKSTIFWIFFLLILFDTCKAETSGKIDSLLTFKHERRVEYFNDLIGNIITLEIDSSLKYLKILELKYPEKNSPEYIHILSQLACLYDKRKNTQLFNSYYNSALSVAEQLGEISEIGKIYLIKAESFKFRNIPDSSIYYCLKAKDIFGTINNSENLVQVYHLIGDIYHGLELYSESEYYFKEIVKIGENTPYWNDWRKIVIYTDLGELYKRKNDFKSALNYFKIAEERIRLNKKNRPEYNGAIQLAYLYACMADNYRKAKEIDSAQKFIELSFINLNKEPSLREFYPIIFLNAGKISFEKNDYNKALEYFQIAKDMTLKNGGANILEVYEYLAKCFSKKGDFKEANKLLYLYIENQKANNNLNSGSKLLLNKIFIDYYNSLAKIQRQDILLKSSYTIIITLLILILTYIYYKRRLKISNKLLVNKTIEVIDDNEIILKNQIEVIIESHKEDIDNLTNNTIEKITSNEIEDSTQNDISLDSTFQNLELSKELTELAINIKNKLCDNEIIQKYDFNINDLASLMNTNRDYVSKAINGYYKTPFQVFINEIRVVESIKLMRESIDENIKMENLMQKVGFSNRATFSNSFKRYTGMTPIAFYKNLKNM